MPTPSLLQRLKERKLVQWGIAYLCGAWVLVEATNLVVEQFSWPLVIGRVVTTLAFFGFFVVLVIAWYHGEKGRQWVSGPELLIIALLLLISGGVLSMLGSGEDTSEPPEPPASFEQDDERPSVAVLPCDNLSSDPADEYLASALHDEVLLKLQGISSLFSTGRASVEWYTENPAPLSQVAQELGVRFVGECSVQKYGEQIRFIFQLLDGKTGGQVWAEDYNRDLTIGNLFDIQADIAQRVAQSTQAVLTPKEVADAETRPTDNLQAYEYFLRGNTHFARRQSREDADRAVELYERAVEEDAEFALAWAWLSMAQSIRQFLHGDRAQPLPEATETAEISLRLDPDLPEAHLAIGYSHYYGRRDYEAALREFEIAWQGRPKSAEVALVIASIHRRQGRWTEGIEGLERAVELDPRNAAVLNNLGNAYLRVRQYDDALRYYHRSISVAPDTETPYRVKIQVHLSRGDVEAAREALFEFLARFGSRRLFESISHADGWARGVFAEELDEAAGELGRPGSGEAAWDYHTVRASAASLRGEIQFARVQADSARFLAESWVEESPASAQFHSQLGLTYAMLGRKAEAIREGREAVQIVPLSFDTRSGPPYRVSLTHILILVGEYETAIDELDLLLSIPSVVSVPLLTIDPIYDPLRNHPRFQALLERYRSDVEH